MTRHVTLRSIIVSLMLASFAGISLPAAVYASDFTSTTSLYINSQGGVGGGREHMFTPENSTSISTSYDGTRVAVAVDGLSGTSMEGSGFTVEFVAPIGQTLVPGVYEDAARAGLQEWGKPGIEISGNGVGCNQITGRFEVLEAVFGPEGYIEHFEATFEQHCVQEIPGADPDPGLTGFLQIHNPPPPPPLDIQLTINPLQEINPATKMVTISGSITCNRPAEVSVNAGLAQRASQGAYGTGVLCSASPTQWHAATPLTSESPRFVPGPGTVHVFMATTDPFYGVYLTKNATAAVKLVVKR